MLLTATTPRPGLWRHQGFSLFTSCKGQKLPQSTGMSVLLSDRANTGLQKHCQQQPSFKVQDLSLCLLLQTHLKYFLLQEESCFTRQRLGTQTKYTDLTLTEGKGRRRLVDRQKKKPVRGVMKRKINLFLRRKDRLQILPSKHDSAVCDKTKRDALISLHQLVSEGTGLNSSTWTELVSKSPAWLCQLLS